MFSWKYIGHFMFIYHSMPLAVRYKQKFECKLWYNFFISHFSFALGVFHFFSDISFNNLIHLILILKKLIESRISTLR